MKTARRQELRTNELAQQIDQVGEYVRQNATVLTIVVLGAAIVFGGGYWYVRHRQNTLMDAWHLLSQRANLAAQGTALEQYKRLAEQDLEPHVTLRAWLKVGESAMMQHVKATETAAGTAFAAGQDSLRIAEEAFNKVLASPVADGAAIGQAMLALGVIAENAGDPEKAREWYRKAAGDPRVATTPLPVEAEHRLKNLDAWSMHIEFPPPPPPPSATSAPAVGAAATQPNIEQGPTDVSTAPGSSPMAGQLPSAGLQVEPPASMPAEESR